MEPLDLSILTETKLGWWKGKTFEYWRAIGRGNEVMAPPYEP